MHARRIGGFMSNGGTFSLTIFVLQIHLKIEITEYKTIYKDILKILLKLVMVHMCLPSIIGLGLEIKNTILKNMLFLMEHFGKIILQLILNYGQ